MNEKNYSNDSIENGMKKQIIEMLEVVKDSLEIVKLKSEMILVDEIIDNINDSMNENDINSAKDKGLTSHLAEALRSRNDNK